jgi:hypothetical protein
MFAETGFPAYHETEICAPVQDSYSVQAEVQEPRGKAYDPLTSTPRRLRLPGRVSLLWDDGGGLVNKTFLTEVPVPL